MQRKLHFSWVVAGRVRPSDVIEDFENPRFGFYWWFWLPHVAWNGGKFLKKQTVDFSIMWLCFSVGFTSFYTGEL